LEEYSLNQIRALAQALTQEFAPSINTRYHLNGTGLQYLDCSATPPETTDEDHAKMEEEYTVSVEETMLVRTDESGTIAVERIGAADTSCLQGNGLCIDAASRVLAHVEFVGTAGVGG
jgi:hypothetical protein